MSNLPILILIAVIFIPTSIILVATPYLTRRTESFGVSVTEAVHALPVHRRFRKQYALITGMISCLILLSMLIFSFRLEPNSETWSFVLVGHILALIFLSFFIYLKFHFTIKKLKAEHDWHSAAEEQVTVVDTSFQQQKLAYSALWFIPQIVVMLATLFTGVLLYDKFPEMLPMQYDFDGSITRIVEKSYHAVLFPVAIQCFTISIMAFSYFIIIRSKQQIDASDPENSRLRNIIFRRRWSAFLLVLGFLMSLLFYFIQLNMLLEFDPVLTNIVIFAFVFLVLAGALWLSITVGQGGSRIKLSGKTAASNKANTDQDQYWKLGQFYFNPHDPALFVEKRFGVGWTMNFARPLVWIILLAIIGVPIVLTILFSP